MALQKISNSIKKLWDRFSDKEYRDGFVSNTIDDSLAVQIFSMRERRGWTQEELAERYGTRQSGVCRWEGGEAPQSLKVLKRLAATFDVALVVKFVPFSEFLRSDGPVDKHVASFHHDTVERCAGAQPARHIIVVDPTGWNFDTPSDVHEFAGLRDISGTSGPLSMPTPENLLQ